MKILLFGHTGKLGKELHRVLLRGSHFVYITAKLDFTSAVDRAEIEDTIDGIDDLDLVINCTAMNGMEMCEMNPNKAFMINAIVPGEMAFACASRDVKFIHFSTDYVFWNFADLGGHFDERAACSPKGAYPESKLLGEQLVKSMISDALIFRVSTLYNDTAQGPLDPIRQAVAGYGVSKDRPLKILDQMCCPTSVNAIAGAINFIIGLPAGLDHHGIFHLTTTKPVSRIQFTWAILDRLFGNRDWNFEIFQPEIPRPRISVLDCSMFQEVFGIKLPTWKEDLEGWLFKQPIMQKR